MTPVVFGINGPVLTVRGENFQIAEMVSVDGKPGEVIALKPGFATVQLYENTAGIKVGALVEKTNRPMSLTLCPGIIGGIFDGIMRPLRAAAVVDAASPFFADYNVVGTSARACVASNAESVSDVDAASPSFAADSISSQQKKFRVKILAKVGQFLSEGEIFAEVRETEIITYRAMVPAGIFGEVTHVAGDGNFSYEKFLTRDEISRDEIPSGEKFLTRDEISHDKIFSDEIFLTHDKIFHDEISHDEKFLTHDKIFHDEISHDEISHDEIFSNERFSAHDEISRDKNFSFGEFSVTDEIIKIGGRSVSLSQTSPIRVPRPVKKKFAPTIPLVTGQRVIDSLFPVAKGGTCAIPGGFGTGKTTTQHQIAKFCDADIIIFIGCGERGNEMTEILEDFANLKDPESGFPLLARTVLIANTSDMPVAAREASVYTGITLAEFYRDMGYHVAVMADSTSRWAEALRELSCRLEEIPAEEGYPAYLATRLSAFYERAGFAENKNGTLGSITIIGAVSPQGADFSEPVTLHTKRFTRCFWALDRRLAYARHFPA
ncbi:MAG: hypothetical protein FWD19_06535, partial [Defluviitaleaceae bacterium]|nr:hypothetical protein [Defluviitaleaceae bacterium]